MSFRKNCCKKLEPPEKNMLVRSLQGGGEQVKEGHIGRFVGLFWSCFLRRKRKRHFSTGKRIPGRKTECAAKGAENIRMSSSIRERGGGTQF